MNPYLIFVLVAISGSTLLDVIINLLNLKGLTTVIPKEFEGFYDAEKYAKSQDYLRESTRFKLLQSAVSTSATVAFLLLGGFNWVDLWARSPGFGEVGSGLLFIGGLVLLGRILNLPFQLYFTFKIEEKYGFNKTTAKIFIADQIKAIGLGIVLGGALLSLVIWIFDSQGAAAWLTAWTTVSGLQIFLMFLVPAFIMPLFNRFTPLGESEAELTRAIESYAQSQNFKLQGIFKMDGSKRSTRANAFFTGFGRYRRIVLFDTLIQKHSHDELVAVLAHEIGHYKKKHIFKSLALSIAASGVMFYAFSLLFKNADLFVAFQMENVTTYGSLVLISFLYGPVSIVLGLLTNSLSRKYEFEADRFAVETYKKPQELANALKRLSVDNLANLTPHPLKVLFEYSHPPVIQRVRALMKK